MLLILIIRVLVYKTFIIRSTWKAERFCAFTSWTGTNVKRRALRILRMWVITWTPPTLNVWGCFRRSITWRVTYASKHVMGTLRFIYTWFMGCITSRWFPSINSPHLSPRSGVFRVTIWWIVVSRTFLKRIIRLKTQFRCVIALRNRFWGSNFRLCIYQLVSCSIAHVFLCLAKNGAGLNDGGC